MNVFYSRIYTVHFQKVLHFMYDKKYKPIYLLGGRGEKDTQLKE